MEKIIVIFSAEVEGYLKKLTTTLFEEEYFGFEGAAQEYVDKIISEIEQNIHLKRHHASPNQFLKHGKYYIKVSGSKRTMWYVFFDKKGTRFFIETIINNHIAPAAFLNL